MIRPDIAIGKLVATAELIRNNANKHQIAKSYTTGFKLDSDARYIEDVIAYIKFLEARNIGAGSV